MKDREKISLAHLGFYCIRSKSLDFYNVPFYASGNKEAVNVVRNSVLGGRDIAMQEHLDDLSLYLVGHFNSDNGVITPTPEPLFICELSEIPILSEIRKESEKV